MCKFLAACVLAVTPVDRLSAESCASVTDLAWMLGRWESRTDTVLNTETWTRAGADSFEGRGFTYSLPQFNKTFEESIRLAPSSGRLNFTADVAHNEHPVSFVLTACSADSVVFENPEHDFPTRIAYHLLDAGHMRVDVSGPAGDGFSHQLSKTNADRRIALTFDDAPGPARKRLTGTDRTRRLIENLAAAGSPPVIFFSRAMDIDEQGDARMRAYQEAGHYIGNHSYSHQRIHRIGVDAFIADIRKAHDILAAYENFVPLFRFPFLDEGRDEVTRDRLRQELGALGYRNGYVTIDNYDFFMDRLMQQAVEQGRAVNEEQLGQAYAQSLMESVRFYADVADRYLEKSPVHTLLLHENDIAALHVGQLIAALREEGWVLVDARAAYDDPIAGMIPDTLFNNQGRVAAIASARGANPGDLVHRAEGTAYLELMFEEKEAFGAPRPWMPGDSDLLFSSNREQNTEIYLLPAGSRKWVNLSNHPAMDNYPVWSPDGSKIAFQSNRNGKLDIFVMDPDGANVRQLTDHPEHDYLPSWTADGAMITFSSWRAAEGQQEGKNHIYIMNADGSGQRRLLEESPGTSATVQWSPDGQRMIRTIGGDESSASLYIADASGTVAVRLTDDGRFNGAPEFSPGGSKVAFYSEYQDDSHLVVMNADGTERRSLTEGGQSYYPHWSPDGCWLVYSAAVVPGNHKDLEIRAIRSSGSGDWVTLVSAGARESEASWRPGKPGQQMSCE